MGTQHSNPFNFPTIARHDGFQEKITVLTQSKASLKSLGSAYKSKLEFHCHPAENLLRFLGSR